MKLYHILLFAPMLLASCGGSRKATSNQIQLDEISVNSKDSEYRAAADRIWDITHTRVALSFNYLEKTARGRAWIDMKPYFYDSDTIKLDAQTMKIDTVLVDGDFPIYHDYSNDVITIGLRKEHSTKDPVRIYVAYTAEPYKSKSGGSDAINDDKGLYFVNANKSVAELPTQIWTQGETQANSHWVPTIDKPNERFTTQIEMTVPKEYKTLSNGKLIQQIETSPTLRTDIWRTEKEIQPYVMTMVIGDYTIVEDEPWNGKAINYYVEPQYASYAKEMFNHTPEMVDYFSKVTGVPYPWYKYSQVVVRDFVSGAMENTSATTFGEFINQNSREIRDEDYEDVVAHELFHQWFGDYVTAESWSNITLNESFANYGEQLWRNYKYSAANAQVLAYEDLHIYLGASKNNDPPLARYHYKSREDLFDRISYQKGGATLHYLHGLIGDEAFSLSMKTYLTEHALQPAEVDDWRQAIEEVTGRDMNWFFDQWYHRGGHPILEISYKFNDAKYNATITIKQKQKQLYRLPLYIDLVDSNKRHSQLLEFNKREQTYTLPYYSNARPVFIPDSKHWLVGEILDNRSTEEWVWLFKLADKEDFITKVNAIVSNKNRINNNDIAELYKLALKDNLYKVREYTLNNLLDQDGNALKSAWKDIVLDIAVNDESHHVRAVAFKLLAKWEVTDIYDAINKGLADESYKVNAEAILALNAINHDSAYTVAQQYFKNDPPRGELLSVIWLVIGDEANPADTTLINKYRYKIRGNKKINYAEGLYEYITRTSNDNAFMNITTLNTAIVLNENISSYRQAIASSLFSAAFFYKNEMQEAARQKDVDRAKDRFAKLVAAIDIVKKKETNEDNIRMYSTYYKQLLAGL